MVTQLEKRIRGDWFDIRDLSARFFSIKEYFRFSRETVAGIAEQLREAAGIVQIKREAISQVCYALDEVQFQSLTGKELGHHRRSLESVLFISLLQRLITMGKAVAERPQAQTVPADDLDVRNILEDVRSRVAEQPDLERHASVKAIFLQMKMYQQELRKAKELVPNLDEEKRKQLSANFQSSSTKLFEAIRRHYGSLMEENQQAATPQKSPRILENLDLQELTTHLTNQIRHVSAIRSTVAFAEKERYQTRQMLVDIGKNRGQTMELFDREDRSHADLCETEADPQECTRRLGGDFCAEVVRIIERHFLRGA